MQNCINQFTTLAKSEQCRFIGNVGLGRDITLAQLRPYYHAVVMVSPVYCVLAYIVTCCVFFTDYRLMVLKMIEYWEYLVRYELPLEYTHIARWLLIHSIPCHHVLSDVMSYSMQ